jgi:hypothetical protein
LSKIPITLLAISVTISMITGVFAQCAPCTGKVTGGGQIQISTGGEASFGFNAMKFSRNEFPNGELEYVDHDSGDKVHAHLLDYLDVWYDNPGNKPMPLLKADFGGPCTLNHVEGYKFHVYVEDHGEPSSPDIFRIMVWDSGDNLIIDEMNVLLHGNIQIHKPPR